jgi:hypothetical protein
VELPLEPFFAAAFLSINVPHTFRCMKNTLHVHFLRNTF